jgi:quinol monooxygenase YgiN
MNVKYGLLAKLQARPGRADDLAKLLETARELAVAENGTVTWYAFRTGDSTFGIFDTFADEAGRQAHLNGRIPVALGEVASELLSSDPVIDEVAIVAVK